MMSCGGVGCVGLPELPEAGWPPYMFFDLTLLPTQCDGMIPRPPLVGPICVASLAGMDTAVQYAALDAKYNST